MLKKSGLKNENGWKQVLSIKEEQQQKLCIEEG